VTESLRGHAAQAALRHPDKAGKRPRTLDFQIDLERRGIMFAAGPFWNDAETGWEGKGRVLVSAASLAEARKIADSDPMHKSGACSYTVRPWLINEGSIAIKLDYSTGKYQVT
jgi:uncharacterized protein YciI